MLDFRVGLVRIRIGWRALDAHPAADGSVPADDAVEDARMILNDCVAQHDRFAYAHARSNCDTEADRYVGSDDSGRIDDGRRVNEDVANDCGLVGSVVG